MADAQTNTPQLTPQSGDADGGSQSKLFAGKYKTPEELEQGYKELERGYHDTRQEMRQIRELIETRIPEREPEYGSASRESYVPQYQQGYIPSTPQADPNIGTQVLTRFYQDPVGTLQSVKEAAKREVKEELTREQRKAEDYRQRVSNWASKNQDVSAHQDMLEYWVARTDGRLTPEARLDQAAQKVRERLLQLRGQPQNSGPNPGDHVEAPGGSGYQPQRPAQQAQQQDPEAELKSYVAERAAARGPKKVPFTPSR